MKLQLCISFNNISIVLEIGIAKILDRIEGFTGLINKLYPVDPVNPVKIVMWIFFTSRDLLINTPLLNYF